MSKKPPHSPEIEGFLISVILLDPGELVKCLSSGLRPEAFYTPANRLIYNRLMVMLGEGKPIDVSALSHELTLAKELEAVGGYSYLMEVSQQVPTTVQTGYYIDKLSEMFKLRQVITACTRLSEGCFNYSGEGVDTMMSGPLHELLDLSTGRSSDQDQTWDEVIDEALEFVDSLGKKDQAQLQVAIDWPFDQMNELFGPIQRGQLVLIAARPSIGKSSLARQLTAVAALRQAKHCYFLTLEVNPVRVVLNMAATATRLGIKTLGSAHPSDKEDFKQSIRDLRSAGIVMSKSEKYIAHVCARAKAMHARRPLDLIVVDHGRLLKDISECRQQEQEAACSRVSSMLKDLASTLNCAVVLLWQLNRGTEKDGNREPKISDMKGSGDLEANADKVILIHRPDTNPDTQQEQDPHTHVSNLPVYFQNLIQGKGRDDGVATLSMDFVREIASFREQVKAEPATPKETQEYIGV